MSTQQKSPRAGRGGAGASARAQYDARRQAGRGLRLALEVSVAAAVGLAVGIVLGWIAGLVAAVAAGVLVAVQLRRSQRSTSAWRKGAKGERKTARMLSKLERRGWHVLHDRSIPGSKANLDHLAIGPGGVWVVDSKYWNSPHSRVNVHRGKLYYGRRRQDRAVDTAAWEAERAAAALTSATRRDVSVETVLAIHGARPWFSARFRAAHAMAAPRLVAFLARRPTVLSAGEISSIAAAAETALPSYTDAPAPSSPSRDRTAGSGSDVPHEVRQPGTAARTSEPPPTLSVSASAQPWTPPPRRQKHPAPEPPPSASGAADAPGDGFGAKLSDALFNPRHATLAGPAAPDGVAIRADMLPSSTWGSNLRGLFPDDWNRLRAPVCEAAGNACELCGAISTRTRRDGKPYRPDCHEKWRFDLDENGALVQRLERLVALCSDCHRVQHAGHANATNQTGPMLAQLRRVNDWTIEAARADLERAQNRWLVLNNCTLDLGLSALAGQVRLDGFPSLYVPAKERDCLGNSFYDQPS